jgi:hypothetical protein
MVPMKTADTTRKFRVSARHTGTDNVFLFDHQELLGEKALQDLQPTLDAAANPINRRRTFSRSGGPSPSRHQV